MPVARSAVVGDRARISPGERVVLKEKEGLA
jgi:hypothetical protein